MSERFYIPITDPPSGVFYTRLTEGQVRAALRRWARREASGNLNGQEMLQLSRYRENPDWVLWCKHSLIGSDELGQTGLRDILCVVAVSNEVLFREVKTKPEPRVTEFDKEERIRAAIYGYQ